MRPLTLAFVRLAFLVTAVVLCIGNTAQAAVVSTDGPSATVQVTPILSIANYGWASPGEKVTLFLSFQANDDTISSLAFSIDYDQSVLQLDNTDDDGDGTPDAVVFSVPPAFTASGSLDLADSDGELDIAIFDPASPLVALPSAALMSVTFTVLPLTESRDTLVAFSTEPSPSYGSIDGTAVAGSAESGIVQICPLVSPTQTLTGSISSATSNMSYCFTNVADGWVTVRMFAWNSQLSPLIRLWTQSGNQVAEANLLLTAQLPTGVYRIEARGTGSTLGAFRLRFETGRAAALGDINRDCLVNLTDLSTILSQFGTSQPEADLDLNGQVNLFDLTTVLANFGMTCNGIDESIRRIASEPGDCNSDKAVDAGDLSALVLEIFDGDGTDLLAVPEGSYAGTLGCDANSDFDMDAGDISCTVLTIFDDLNACGGSTKSTTVYTSSGELD